MGGKAILFHRCFLAGWPLILRFAAHSDSNCAIPRSLQALLGCKSDGDSELILCDSTAIRLNLLLLAAEFLAIPACDSENCALRGSQFCATKPPLFGEVGAPPKPPQKMIDSAKT